MRDDLFIYWRIHPTKELDIFWKDFYNEHEGLQEPFNKAIEVFEIIRREQGVLPSYDISLLPELKAIIAKKEKRRKLRKIITSSAAAVLLLMLISTIFILQEKSDKTASPLSSLGEVMGSTHIQLFTGTDILDIDNNATLDLSGNNQGAIIQNPLMQKEIDLDQNKINKLVVPYGKRSTLILADGSKVHLNSGTKMEFPGTFSDTNREISIEGEIFIDVVHQEGVPFVIHTPHSQVTVHGTSFNLSSYAEDKSESVVLVNGAVEVKSENSSLMLKPNEMAEIENGRILRRQVDVSNYTGWVNGYMQLNKSPLDEVLKKIGRYYNVKYQYDTDLRLHDQTCSGKLFLSDNLDDVLEAFSKMTYLRYDKQDDRTIFIRQ